MTKIIMPPRFDLISVNSWCIKLDNIELSEECSFDYSSVTFFEPSGMLLCSAKIRQFIKLHPQVSFSDKDFTHHTYAANMGFFQSVYQDYGKSPGEALGNDNYLPISKINVSEVRKKALTDSKHIVDTLQEEARRLSAVLSRNDSILKTVLTYTIRELLRNVVEHSFAQEIWYSGQFWPSKNRVEIAILDEGIGIYNSLKKNNRLCVKSNVDALKASILPGVTSVRSPNPNDEYANSGYGLYLTRRIAVDGGDFVILSNDCMLGSNKLHAEILRPASFQGTLIRIRLNTSSIPSLDEQLSKYISEGEKLAKKIKQNAIVTASQISRLIHDDYN
jgi:anti-sigma regulatory factor (Ser/Thr protein kinase)